MIIRTNVFMATRQVLQKTFICHSQIHCIHTLSNNIKCSSLQNLYRIIELHEGKESSSRMLSPLQLEKTCTRYFSTHGNSSSSSNKEQVVVVVEEKVTREDQRESVTLPQPIPDPNDLRFAPVKIPKTWKGWKTVCTGAWTEYKNTWEGFALGGQAVMKESSNQDTTSPEQKFDHVEGKITTTRNAIKSNVERNLKFVKKDGTELVEKVQEHTGIYTTEDLKKWAADQMKLATECLSQFMAGYRKGRDDEIDKMLNQYFNELEQDEEGKGNADTHKTRKRRRKPKKRVLKR